jgi:hypothetical protein
MLGNLWQSLYTKMFPTARIVPMNSWLPRRSIEKMTAIHYLAAPVACRTADVPEPWPCCPLSRASG